MRAGARTCALALAAAVTAACNRTPSKASSDSTRSTDPPPPAAEPPPARGPVTVTGGEKLRWEQQVGAGTKVAEFSFFLYVDGAKRPLPGVECHLQQGSRHHVCEAPLPAMTRGTHALRISAAREVRGHAKVSPLSEPVAIVRGALPGG